MSEDRPGPVSGCMRQRRRCCAASALPAAIIVALAAGCLPPAAAAPPLVDLAGEPPGAACPSRPDSIRGAAAVASTPSGMAVFQAGARPADWSGQFFRSALTVDAAGTPQVSAPLWEAAAVLDGLPDAAGTRRIYTSKMLGGSRITVPFQWDQLSAAQRAALNRAPPPAKPVSDGKGALRLDYLRGDRSLEGGTFRRRGAILGDAVHSVPVYVGQASADHQESGGGTGSATGSTTGDGYRAHYDSMLARRPAVYLGSNDGMLHAFDASSGAELFAYVPDAVFGQLNRLPARGYVHAAYVDGPAGAAEAQLAGAWRSVLVSAMGTGAQGVFALDVTDPATFPLGGGALWEFTDADDAAMGSVTAPPQIVRMRLRGGAGSSGSGDYRYFAVVASGYNSLAADSHVDTDGAGALFLLALDKPAGEAWRLNRNYYRLQVPAGDPDLLNGLGAPVLVLDDANALRHAYAGDLQGNLWRFNFTGSAPWRGAAEGPLFAARDARGMRQPISAQPKAAHAPEGGYLILFGTGKLLGETDRNPAGYAQQSFYAVLDDSATGARPASGWPYSRADLARRELDGAPAGADFQVRGRGFAYGGASGARGWYLDFAGSAAGERSVGSPTLMDGQVFFNTVLTGSHACAAIHGRSYALGLLSGLAPDAAGLPLSGEASGQLLPDYVPGPPVPVPVPAAAGAGAGPGADAAAGAAKRQGNGRRVVARDIVVVNFGTAAGDTSATGATPAGAASAGRTRAVSTAGRIGWREVANWRELYQAARARAERP